MSTQDNGFEEVNVFVSGTDGVCQYRIPALVTATDGALIAVCDARIEEPGDAPNNIDLVVKRSVDGGRTWSATERIAQFPGTEAACDPCMLVDRETGTIWVFYDYAVPHDSLPRNRRIMTHVIASDDHGRTWSKPKDLTPEINRPEWYYVAAAPGMGIQTRDGKLVAPVYTKRRDEPSKSHVLWSEDHGETWILGGGAGTDTGECQVVELDDDRLLINMRRPKGAGCRSVACSDDGGHSWSEAVDDPALIEPACQASFIRLTSTRDGDDKSRLLFSNPAHASQRLNMTVRLSYDEGKTWPVAKLVNPERSMYSCLTVLPDKTIGLLYEKGKILAFARFSLAWLTDGEDGV